MVRHAARGDAEAFAELFRRHSQPAWRLAQAVAPDRDKAVAAFRDGFSKAIRAQRSRRDAARRTFRPQVLASVYRAGLDHGAERAGAATRSSAATAEAALTDAAFRSLPERWRAAVWLSEVENLEPGRIAAILGVSMPVATQLVARGRRGLLGRFAQAHQEAPQHVGTVLRAVAVAMPANLADVTRQTWASTRGERAPIFSPATTWLEDKAKGPMSAAVVGLVALGVIGLAVVPEGATVRGNLGASGIGNPSGSVPVRTCFGVPCGSTSSATSLGSPGSFSPAAYSTTSSGITGATGGGSAGTGLTSSPSSPTVGTTPTGGGTSTGGGTGSTPTGSTPTTPTGGSTTPPGGGGSTTPPGGGTTTPPGGGSTGPLPSTSLNLAPVASISTTGSSATVNLLPTSSGSAVSTTLGTGGVNLSVGGTTILNTTPSTTVPSTGTSSGGSTGTSSGGSLGSTVTGVVGGVTNTVTKTVSGLLGG